MEETLHWNDLVLLAPVNGLEHAAVVLEVFMKLQVEDREQRHRCIEVLRLLMEVEIHCTEVDLEVR